MELDDERMKYVKEFCYKYYSYEGMVLGEFTFYESLLPDKFASWYDDIVKSYQSISTRKSILNLERYKNISHILIWTKMLSGYSWFSCIKRLKVPLPKNGLQ